MHNVRLGFCVWDVLALIVLAAMVAVLAVHLVRHRKRKKEFEDELSAKMAEEQTAESKVP